MPPAPRTRHGRTIRWYSRTDRGRCHGPHLGSLVGSAAMVELADRWSRWLLHDRFGGDELALQRTLEHLKPIRDRVLAAAHITPGNEVIDVGCGDGLLGFSAVSQVGENGQVIFSDGQRSAAKRTHNPNLLVVRREPATQPPRPLPGWRDPSMWASRVHCSPASLESDRTVRRLPSWTDGGRRPVVRSSRAPFRTRIGRDLLRNATH